MRPRVSVRLLVALLGGGATTCLQADVYPCDGDLQCRQADRNGLCVAAGWCAYPDEGCHSGYRYSEHAGDDAAHACVEPGEGTAGFDTGALTGGAPDDGSAEGVGTGLDSCIDGCDTPPGPCFAAEGACDADTELCVYEPLPAGAACDATGLCAAVGTCDAAGLCIPDTPVQCDAPPSPCHEPEGSCDLANGECVYALQPSGAPCDDGDPCSVGDVCDEAGACIGGEACPSANPCEVGTCEAGACVFAPIVDGASCGPDPADRCCAGTCVDISSDPVHCGGCATVCGAAKSCQTVASTPECSPAPASTSGRCTCNANTDCPQGQICRTVNPGGNLCAPEGDRDCHGVYVDVVSCPNYCTY